MHRRQFLRKTLAAGAALPVLSPARSLAAAGVPPPSERIALGFIGLGSHGIGVNLKSFLNEPDAQVVALCDVDAAHLADAVSTVSSKYGTAKGGSHRGLFTTGDWREIVARDDIDAVVVSTPDHWHVLPSVAAARTGKDVFCEKPLTLTVHEGRVLSDAMQRYGRVFQTASENRTKQNFRRACELVRNGRIGTLRTIYTELPRGRSAYTTAGRSYEPEPVPRELDYDMWLGPAPEAPYCRERCHYNFRWILDYSGGHVTDWGAHLNDIAQWANGTDRSGPVSVEGHGVFPPDGLYNVASEFEIIYEYANGVRLVCRSGLPSIRFEGSEGWIDVATWEAAPAASSPEILNAVIGPDEWQLPVIQAREHREFLDCVKSRRDTYAPAEVGHRTATVCHLGNISMLLGRKLRWNPNAERFVNNDQANAMLSRVMRAPWHL